MRSLLILTALAPLACATSVTVATPATGTIHRWITLPARLEPNQSVTLHAKVAGHLKAIHVDTGDVVAAGAPIAELEVPELEADHIKAAAELEVANAELARLETARAKAPGLILPQAFDAASGRQRIAAASMQRTEVLLGYARITAPFAGTITARHADPGAFIPAGGTGNDGATVTLADLSVLRARVPVPEQEAGFIKPGTLARILTTSNAAGLDAKVARLAQSIASPSATMAVEVDLPNTDGRLLAGSYVKAQLACETHSGVMLIPAAALLTEKTSTAVFVVKDGKAVKTKVTCGFNDGRQVEVTAGLRGDEPLAILTGLTLNDGQAVEASPAAK